MSGKNAPGWVDLAPSISEMREEVLHGLLSPVKRIPAKYLYDAEGSMLFERITHLPEYYPTRVETEILRDHAREIARVLGDHPWILEYGTGSGAKTRYLLRELPPGTVYMPVDISRESLESASSNLRAEFPLISARPVVADYTRSSTLGELEKLAAGASSRTVFFPGSTFGNFEPEEAGRFLDSNARMLGAGGTMVLGIDLLKDVAVLEDAYNDTAGVTAEFNLNLLRRLNRELDADFNLDLFGHLAFFNLRSERIEMHLESLEHQDVTVAGRRIHFEPGETIHTENSYKYSIHQLERMAREHGFDLERVWQDSQGYFAVVLLRARGGAGLRVA